MEIKFIKHFSFSILVSNLANTANISTGHGDKNITELLDQLS